MAKVLEREIELFKEVAKCYVPEQAEELKYDIGKLVREFNSIPEFMLEVEKAATVANANEALGSKWDIILEDPRKLVEERLNTMIDAINSINERAEQLELNPLFEVDGRTEFDTSREDKIILCQLAIDYCVEHYADGISRPGLVFDREEPELTEEEMESIIPGMPSAEIQNKILDTDHYCEPETQSMSLDEILSMLSPDDGGGSGPSGRENEER